LRPPPPSRRRHRQGRHPDHGAGQDARRPQCGRFEPAGRKGVRAGADTPPAGPWSARGRARARERAEDARAPLLTARERRLSTITRSELEERFLALVKRATLPEPELNQRLAGYEVDFLWRPQRRVIEVDGFAYHSTRQAANRDRRKDDDLEAAGYGVTRFTADQVLHDPHDTLERTKRAVLNPQ